MSLVNDDVVARRAHEMTEEFLSSREARVVVRICAKLSTGEALDSEEAKQAWYEIHASRRLKEALGKRSQGG